MANLIKIKRSTNAGVVPTLQDGEIAINLADMKFFVKNAAGTTKFIDFTSDAEKVNSGPIKAALDSLASGINAKINRASDTFTGKIVMAPVAGAIAQTAGGLAKLQVVGNGGAGDAAFLEFHRPGIAGGYFGLDSDNEWKFGGWTFGNTSYKFWHQANFNPDTKANITGQTFSGDLGVTRPSDAALYLHDTSAPTTNFRQKAILSSKNVGGGDTLLFRFTRPSDGALRDFTLGGVGGTIFHTGNFDPNTKQDKGGGLILDATGGEKHPWEIIQQTGQSVYQYGTANDIGIYDTKDGRIWNYNKPGKVFNITPNVSLDGSLSIGGSFSVAGALLGSQVAASRTDTVGGIYLQRGGASNTGYIEFYNKGTAARLGYLGFGTEPSASGPGSISIAGERSFFNFIGLTPKVNGGDIWSANKPDGYYSAVTVPNNNNPYVNTYTFENNGQGFNADTFYLPNVNIHTTSNQVGHREQFHTEMRSNGGPAGKFIVGANIGTTINSGQGNAFALNGVTIIEGGLSGNIEASVSELNMVCKSNVIRKTILQLVDVAGSGGRGTTVDAALLIAKQYGAFGNNHAIEIGSLDDSNQWPVNSDILYCNPGTCGTGIDLRKVGFTSAQAVLLAPGHQITWAAGGGGHIRSDTDRNSMSQVFFNGGLAFQVPGGGGFRFSIASAALHPEGDGAASLGQPSLRWNTVFAATGSIQTSDEKFKTGIQDPDDILLDAVGDIEVKVFKYLASVEEKGEDSARIHTGVIAQQVEEAMINRGIDPALYAFWCEDPLMEDVEETVEEQQQEYNDIEYEEKETVFEDKKAVIKTVKKIRREPVLDQYPVFNEDGTPHMLPARPARTAQDANGNTIEVSGEAKSYQMFAAKPRMKTIQVTKTVKKQKVDKNGKPMTQLGIRYTDLAILLHAWTRRELRKR